MKNRKTLFAPQIDVIVKNLHHEKDLVNHNICLKIKNIYSIFSCIKPCDTDDIRQIWLQTERGGIKNFGSFKKFRKSGEVESAEEFEELWKTYYPRYCHSLFPKEDRIIDFMNLGYDREIIPGIIKKSDPLEEIEVG
jgi:hypothetical protein